MNSQKDKSKDLNFLIVLLIINVVCIVPLLFFLFSFSVGVTTQSVSISIRELQELLTKIVLFLCTVLILNIVLINIYKITTNQIRNPFKKSKTIGEEMNGK